MPYDSTICEYPRFSAQDPLGGGPAGRLEEVTHSSKKQDSCPTGFGSNPCAQWIRHHTAAPMQTEVWDGESSAIGVPVVGARPLSAQVAGMGTAL